MRANFRKIFFREKASLKLPKAVIPVSFETDWSTEVGNKNGKTVLITRAAILKASDKDKANSLIVGTRLWAEDFGRTGL